MSSWRAAYRIGIAGLALLSMLAALYAAFVYAPTEKTMGDVQRIFYFHVSAWWVSGLAFTTCAVASIAYLLTRRLQYDRVAVSGVEIGVLFTTIGLVTGTIWAKPIWGIWWTWDIRLTTAFVLWLIFVVYLMLRQYIADEHKRASLSAVTAFFGFIDIPIVWFSIRWWRTQHPAPVIAGGEGSGLHPDMATAFLVCLTAFFFLFLWLMERRLALARTQETIDSLYKRLEAN